MARLNENFLKLNHGYLFPEIARRVNDYSKKNPSRRIIRMGIGDVTQPLAPSVINAFEEAVKEMGCEETFRGYGPEQGYHFLREQISLDYADRGVNISSDEIFVSDGSKCDTGNILEIFDIQSKIGVCDPVYPVYVDVAVMAGRTGNSQSNGYFDGLVYLPCCEDNDFLPVIPNQKLDIVFLCFPNNPTGQVATKEYLSQWVNYAIENNTIILYDAAYEAFIRDSNIPHSIYEIPNAKEVAIEFKSLSKTAGFTGTRCAFTMIPNKLKAQTKQGDLFSVHSFWLRRQNTKFNGVSYPVQKAATAIYSESGKRECAATINYYLENARLLLEGLTKKGFKVYGGTNAPYLWVKTLNQMDSWDFFDLLLKTSNIVITPGAGFGPSGQGFFRMSAFASRDDIEEAVVRILNNEDLI